MTRRHAARAVAWLLGAAAALAAGIPAVHWLLFAPSYEVLTVLVPAIGLGFAVFCVGIPAGLWLMRRRDRDEDEDSAEAEAWLEPLRRGGRGLERRLRAMLRDRGQFTRPASATRKRFVRALEAAGPAQSSPLRRALAWRPARRRQPEPVPRYVGRRRVGTAPRPQVVPADPQQPPAPASTGPLSADAEPVPVAPAAVASPAGPEDKTDYSQADTTVWMDAIRDLLPEGVSA